MRCITIKSYHLDSDIYRATELSDRAFSLGFRIVNPEYSTTIERLIFDTERLAEFIEQHDSSEYIGTTTYPKRKIHPSRDPNRRTI